MSGFNLENVNLETLTNADMLTPTHGNIIPSDGDISPIVAQKNPKIAAALEIEIRTLAAIDTRQDIRSKLWASQALQNATEIGDEIAAIQIMSLMEQPAEQGGFKLSRGEREDMLVKVEKCLRNAAIRIERYKKMKPNDYAKRLQVRRGSGTLVNKSAEQIFDMWKNVAGQVQGINAEKKAHSPLTQITSAIKSIGRTTQK